MKTFKCLFLAIMIVVAGLAYAEKGDNTVAPSTGEKPAVLEKTSYFQGTWIGNWQTQNKTGRDITIVVGPKYPDGTFDIEYSWGSGTDLRGRAIFPGNVKAKGREDGEKLVFDYTDPVADNRAATIVMRKVENDKARAQLEGIVIGGIIWANLSRK